MTPRQVVQALRDAQAAGVLQTTHSLVRPYWDEETHQVLWNTPRSYYCALGVIFKAAGASDREIWEKGYEIPLERGIDFDGWDMCDFYKRNDVRGMTFGEIADEFEKHLDEIGHPKDDAPVQV